MVSWLDKKSDRIHDEDFVNGWETSGRAAIRKGDWKAVYLPSPRGTDQWQLYNLEKDLGEVHDLATERPDILKDLLKLWDRYVIETGVVPLDPALGEYIAATEEQLPDNGWMEYEFWKKGAKLEGNREKFLVTPKRFDRLGARVA